MLYTRKHSCSISYTSSNSSSLSHSSSAPVLMIFYDSPRALYRFTIFLIMTSLSSAKFNSQPLHVKVSNPTFPNQFDWGGGHSGALAFSSKRMPPMTQSQRELFSKGQQVANHHYIPRSPHSAFFEKVGRRVGDLESRTSNSAPVTEKETRWDCAFVNKKSLTQRSK